MEVKSTHDELDRAVPTDAPIRVVDTEPGPPYEPLIYPYFRDPVHLTLRSGVMGESCHYAAWYGSGVFLGFTPEWREKYLPKDGSKQSLTTLRCVLKDETDGKLYTGGIWAAYQKPDDGSCLELLNEAFEPVRLDSLQGYFYEEHHCPCHRKQDAAAWGAVVENDECEGKRFSIHEITTHDMPSLILMSETRTAEELEEILSRFDGYRRMPMFGDPDAPADMVANITAAEKRK